jgi:hypothetical protein
VAVTGWGEALSDLLARSGVSVTELAKTASFSRMTIYRYLDGSRTPRSYDVLALNRATQSLVAGKGKIPGNVNVFTYLNVAAALNKPRLLDSASFEPEGPVSLSAVLDGAIETLRTLGVGLLHPDWYERLMDAAKADRPLSNFLIELNREHGRLLLDAVNGEVPARKGHDALRAILHKYQLDHLLTDDSEVADNMETLFRAIRRAIAAVADVKLSAQERFTAERQVLDAVYKFGMSLQRKPSIYEEAINAAFKKREQSSETRRTHK